MEIRSVSRMAGVAKITGARNTNFDDARLVYFLCPCLSSKGIVLNAEGTGFAAKYVDRLSGFTKVRRDKAMEFMSRLTVQGWDGGFTLVWASADALILYSQTDYPAMPDNLQRGVANHVAVECHMENFHRFYDQKPWTAAPAWAVAQEEHRLMSLLPPEASKELKQNFVRRVFAGFALDGFLLRQGYYGQHPVILGVESPGVAVLQNAALPASEQIPVIQLR